jgi:hypothetical protein
MHVQVAIMVTIRLPKFGRNWRPEAKEMQVQPFFAPEFFFPSGRERVKKPHSKGVVFT